MLITPIVHENPSVTALFLPLGQIAHVLQNAQRIIHEAKVESTENSKLWNSITRKNKRTFYYSALCEYLRCLDEEFRKRKPWEDKIYKGVMRNRPVLPGDSFPGLDIPRFNNPKPLVWCQEIYDSHIDLVYRRDKFQAQQGTARVLREFGIELEPRTAYRHTVIDFAYPDEL